MMRNIVVALSLERATPALFICNILLFIFVIYYYLYMWKISGVAIYIIFFTTFFTIVQAFPDPDSVTSLINELKKAIIVEGQTKVEFQRMQEELGNASGTTMEDAHKKREQARQTYLKKQKAVIDLVKRIQQDEELKTSVLKGLVRKRAELIDAYERSTRVNPIASEEDVLRDPRTIKLEADLSRLSKAMNDIDPTSVVVSQIPQRLIDVPLDTTYRTAYDADIAKTQNNINTTSEKLQELHTTINQLAKKTNLSDDFFNRYIEARNAMLETMEGDLSRRGISNEIASRLMDDARRSFANITYNARYLSGVLTEAERAQLLKIEEVYIQAEKLQAVRDASVLEFNRLVDTRAQFIEENPTVFRKPFSLKNNTASGSLNKVRRVVTNPLTTDELMRIGKPQIIASNKPFVSTTVQFEGPINTALPKPPTVPKLEIELQADIPFKLPDNIMTQKTNPNPPRRRGGRPLFGITFFISGLFNQQEPGDTSFNPVLFESREVTGYIEYLRLKNEYIELKRNEKEQCFESERNTEQKNRIRDLKIAEIQSLENLIVKIQNEPASQNGSSSDEVVLAIDPKLYRITALQVRINALKEELQGFPAFDAMDYQVLGQNIGCESQKKTINDAFTRMRQYEKSYDALRKTPEGRLRLEAIDRAARKLIRDDPRYKDIRSPFDDRPRA